MQNPQNHASGDMNSESDRPIDSAPEPYRTPSEIPGNASDVGSPRRTTWRWILLIGGIGLIAVLGLTTLAASVALFGFERSGPPRPLPNAVQGRGNAAQQTERPAANPNPIGVQQEALQPDQENENGD